MDLEYVSLFLSLRMPYPRYQVNRRLQFQHERLFAVSLLTIYRIFPTKILFYHYYYLYTIKVHDYNTIFYTF